MKAKHAYLGFLAFGSLGFSLFAERMQQSDASFAESSAGEAVIAEAEAAGLNDSKFRSIESNVGQLAQMVRVFSYPIELYGKVVDTDGIPVVAAQVKQSFTGEGCDCPEYALTDENGEFYLSGKGSSVYIRVTKDGYYEAEESKGSVGYTVPSERPPANDPSNPAIFVLRKHGEAEPLVKFGEKWGRAWSIPRNGDAVGFDLIEGRQTAYTDAHIFVRAWSPGEKRGPDNERIPYAWKFEVTAPKGGFIERVGEFDFIAPESGYVESFSFEMPADAERWNDLGHEQEVFAKLKNGNYARVLFRYQPSNSQRGDSFTIESYTNPSGSRNLEYDPELEIK